MFNNLVQDIGRHADNGTLPTLSPDEPSMPENDSNGNVGMTWANMVNVRNDNTLDESTVQTDKADASRADNLSASEEDEFD